MQKHIYIYIYMYVYVYVHLYAYIYMYIYYIIYFSVVRFWAGGRSFTECTVVLNAEFYHHPDEWKFLRLYYGSTASFRAAGV